MASDNAVNYTETLNSYDSASLTGSFVIGIAAYCIDCKTNRVTTCLENLEMSGNLTAVREMSGDFTKNLGNVGEKILSGKSCLKLFIVSICIRTGI